MQFAHILRKERDLVVQVNVTRICYRKEDLFAVYKAGFEEIRETALVSVVHEY